MKYTKEPRFVHGQSSSVGVILVNLGTPETLSLRAVRRYLTTFLSDPRVVELPSFLWQIFLRLFLVPFRARGLLHKYRSIWLPEGSPLRVYTARQSDCLQQIYDEDGRGVCVRYAMRYGAPSLDAAYRELAHLGCRRFLIFPLYPQYASSTTASVCDAFFSILKKRRYVPEFRFIHHFYQHKAYIEAMTLHVRSFWAKHGRTDQILFSFHGIPKSSWADGDPYPCHCYATARALAQSLDLPAASYSVAFQSRFGKAAWVTPYSVDLIKKMALSGVKELTIISPSFVSDCLETSEEIDIFLRRVFLAHGGEKMFFIPSLNDSFFGISALEKIISEQIEDWLLLDSLEDGALIKKNAMARGAPD